MFRYTTPTITFTIKDDFDMTQASDVYMTFTDSNGNIQFTKQLSEEELTVTEHTVAVRLTQAESASIPGGTFRAQLNWLYNDNDTVLRDCSDIVEEVMEDNLLPIELPEEPEETVD